MKKEELMGFVGKKVFVYFKDSVGGIYGILGYADEFSAKHDYRKPKYFYIGHISFKVSHVRKVAECKEANCTDCILDGTDACSRGAGRAVDDEICEDFTAEGGE